MTFASLSMPPLAIASIQNPAAANTQSHHFLRSGARFSDGARALLLADQALYQGRYAPAIRQAIQDRGISLEEREAYRPSITEDRYAQVTRAALRASRGFPWWM
jgi:hypothetical protein